MVQTALLFVYIRKEWEEEKGGGVEKHKNKYYGENVEYIVEQI